MNFDVINGTIGRILMQDTHLDGLKSITLNEFGSEVADLDVSLLYKLVDLS